MARIAYESDLVTLWEGDCAEVIADLPRDSVDLIATDPPYDPGYVTTAIDRIKCAEDLAAEIAAA